MLSLCVLQFSHLQNKYAYSYITVWLEGLNETLYLNSLYIEKNWNISHLFFLLFPCFLRYFSYSASFCMFPMVPYRDNWIVCKPLCLYAKSKMPSITVIPIIQFGARLFEFKPPTLSVPSCVSFSKLFNFY